MAQMMRRRPAHALMRVKPQRTAGPTLPRMHIDRDDLRRQVLDAIHAVAPEIDVARVPADQPLRDVFDLDSMDWLNVVAGVEQRLDLDIPPRDLGRLSTVDAIVDYVASRRTDDGPALSPPSGALPCRTYVVQGLPVMVRPMCPEDMALEDEFVQRLSRESRYMRFMVTLNELPGSKLRALTHVDQSRHVALAAVVLVDKAPALAGVARYVVDDTGVGCEFALALDDAWQHSGLAGILMLLLMEVARSRGLARMEGLVLRANDRMLKLGRQLGFRRLSDPDDHETVRLVREL